jgi:hypothetical protein
MFLVRSNVGARDDRWFRDSLRVQVMPVDVQRVGFG